MLYEVITGIDLDRQQVRVGEIAVVVGLFLGTHGAGFLLLRVEQARLLHHLATALDDQDLALDLVVDRLLDEAEGIDVLQLGAGAELA